MIIGTAIIAIQSQVGEGCSGDVGVVGVRDAGVVGAVVVLLWVVVCVAMLSVVLGAVCVVYYVCCGSVGVVVCVRVCVSE